MQSRCFRAIGGAALLTLIAAPAWAASAHGRLMALTMTTTMQMQGMLVPPQTTSRKILCTSGYV